MHRLGKLALCTAVLLVLLPGCTWVSHRVELDYSAPLVPAAPAVEAAATSATVAVGSVVDQRMPSEFLGVVNNGYGMRVADVVTNDDALAWVRQGLRAELRHAGFDVVGADARLTIDIELTRVTCSAGPSYEAAVNFGATVYRGDQRLVAGFYTGKGSTGPSWTAATEELSASLDLALQDALRQLIRDLRRRSLGID